MDAREHAVVWRRASEILSERIEKMVKNERAPEVIAATLAAAELANAVAKGYWAEAENAPD
ncbi:hypothetical protein LCGC14_3061770 [marine sediment metagenome]|uniref:Uncharacterized protein n=1 Tax=marine sediment metagenome TaxID=412755 RepID=A0A0F8WJ80_9ZZZZ